MEVALNGKLNEKEELICIKSIFKYKEGERYKFRFDPPDAIYIYYPLDEIRGYLGLTIGNRFLTVNHTNWNIEHYNEYFITLSEYRKRKLQKINSL